MTSPDTAATTATPVIERVRHERKRRSLTVTENERLTPNMIRIHLTGEDLSDFSSLSPDDHVKLFAPDETGEMAMRDYTPRRYDVAARTLLIDFAVHDAGPATQWAINAKPGDSVDVGGPRGSQIITGDIPNWLLVGDETALPAIGRRIEEAPAGTSITTLIAVPGPDDQQSFESGAKLTHHWVYRDIHDAAEPAPLLDALKKLDIAPETFVWIAAEGLVTRELRRYLLEEREHPKQWLKAAGYWVKGKADATERFDD